MIRKYTFGKPFPTGAVVRELKAETGPVPYFRVSREEGRVILRLDLSPEEIIFSTEAITFSSFTVRTG